MPKPKIVSRDEWTTARKRLLVKEKELTRQRDALSVERRSLPMVALEKEYVFEGPEAGGRRTLRDLFGKQRQLIVYHFMFGLPPDWEDEGCPACSYVADNFAGSLVHLAARETAFAVISRAPFAKIAPFKQRMGWTFPWLSSHGTDFNGDFGVTLDGAFAAGRTVRGRLTIPNYDHLTLELQIERIEAEHFFSYRWHPYAIDPNVDYSSEPTTLVEFRLEEIDGGKGAAVTIVESGFDRIPLARRAEAFRMNDAGWAGQAKKLAQYVA